MAKVLSILLVAALILTGLSFALAKVLGGYWVPFWKLFM